MFELDEFELTNQDAKKKEQRSRLSIRISIILPYIVHLFVSFLCTGIIGNNGSRVLKNERFFKA